MDTVDARMKVQRHTWNRDDQRFVLADADDQRRRFLKGPIPWEWLIQAAQLPGKALVVALCLWRLAGATGKRTIRLANSEVAPFGVDRAAKSRALKALEQAELIAVEHRMGRWPVVTLLVPNRA